MKKNKISVVLVEDHDLVREGLKALLELEDDITVTDHTDNGLDAIKLAETHVPDLVIMDIAMPKLNGIDAAKQILKINPDIKIILLSGYADDESIKKVLTLGVQGFLIKTCSPYILVQAVREVLNGNQFFSPEISKRLKDLNTDQLNNKGVQTKKNMELSLRETQVLQLIVEGNANKLIAHELGISIKTIEKHRQNLMNKLSIHDVAGLTRYAINNGIINSSNKKFNE